MLGESYDGNVYPLVSLMNKPLNDDQNEDKSSYTEDNKIYLPPKKKKNSKNSKEESSENNKSQQKKPGNCACCKTLKQKIKKLESLNIELSKDKEVFFRNNGELMMRNRELKNKNNDLKNINKQLEDINEELDKEIIKLNKDNNDYKIENIDLKKQLISKVNDLTILKNERESYEKEEEEILQHLSKCPSDSQEIIKILINRIRILEKKDLEKNNKISQIQEKMGIMQNILTLLIEKKKNKKSRRSNCFSVEDPSIDISQSLNLREKYKKNQNTKSEYENKRKSIPRSYTDTLDNGNKSYNGNKIKDNGKTDYSDDFSNDYNIKSNYKKNKNSKKEEKSHTPDTKKRKKKFNSKIIKNTNDLDIVGKGLMEDEENNCKDLTVGYKLLYRASEHGEKAKIFHEKCNKIRGTLIIIKTKEGYVFGGYTTLPWDPTPEMDKKDIHSFVFSLNFQKLYYVMSDKDYSIYCDENKGPCFVGMFAIEENILKMKSYVNPWGMQCYSGENKPYEINGGKPDFNVEELEVFQVILKRN